MMFKAGGYLGFDKEASTALRVAHPMPLKTFHSDSSVQSQIRGSKHFAETSFCVLFSVSKRSDHLRRVNMGRFGTVRHIPTTLFLGNLRLLSFANKTLCIRTHFRTIEHMHHSQLLQHRLIEVSQRDMH